MCLQESCPLKSELLPASVSAAKYRAAMDFAFRIIRVGVGEGQKAHGFVIGLCRSSLMAADEQGDFLFGACHDDNKLFSQEQILIGELDDRLRRSVLVEFTKDGSLLVDGTSGQFLASNFFVETGVRFSRLDTYFE